jgi:hypothetical protein
MMPTSEVRYGKFNVACPMTQVGISQRTLICRGKTSTHKAWGRCCGMGRLLGLAGAVEIRKARSMIGAQDHVSSNYDYSQHRDRIRNSRRSIAVL